MDAPLTPALALHDVSKRYGRRWALARLSYQLPTGRSLLLTGHPASGLQTSQKRPKHFGLHLKLPGQLIASLSSFSDPMT